MANKFEIIVQKFGGSSVSSPQKIKDVAIFIKSRLDQAKKVCVVVSAMGHTTNELLSLAHSICENPSKRELDMLISCGERSSMALLAMALNDIGVKAVSLTGSQSGIITTSAHQNAEVIAIRPERVLSSFVDHQAVIIAGFQGVSADKEITTLRRGGSDTTAVVMAAALKAQVCEIFSDVIGVMDVDPNIVARAKLLPEISFKQMSAMALYGAKVLAHDAIEIAALYGVNLDIGQSCHEALGTKVAEFKLDKACHKVLCLTHLRAIVKIKMAAGKYANLATNSFGFLCAYLKNDQVMGFISNDGAKDLLKNGASQIDSGLALITIHLASNKWTNSVLAELPALFSDQGLSLSEAFLGQNEIFVIIKDVDLVQALNILHAKFLSSGSHS